MGLPPLSKIPPSNVHETPDEVKIEHKLNEESRSKLQLFFEPFNELLRIYLNKQRNGPIS